MMCRCGYVFHDNTDHLPWKAHFLADEDMDDYFNTFDEIKETTSKRDIDDIVLKAAHYWERFVYQCPDCGKLYIESEPGTFSVFIPEDQENLLDEDKELLTSIRKHDK